MAGKIGQDVLELVLKCRLADLYDCGCKCDHKIVEFVLCSDWFVVMRS